MTGQHAGLDPDNHGLGGFESVRLRCPGQADPNAHAVAVATRLADHLACQPQLVIVQGDTSSAYGGALAADALNIPLAHVEAGLRTHDLLQPWPEEEFRIAIDARADLLFAVTEQSAANLKAEGCRGEIHVTGNTGIDAVLAAAEPAIKSPEPRLLVTCHRRESWGEGLKSIAAALRMLAADITVDFILHPNPNVADAMRGELSGVAGVRLNAPLSHTKLLAMMQSATLTLTDSGGMQEEAATLGAPLLVLRDKTERPEAIATGNMILVGTATARIVQEVRRLLADPAALAAMGRPAFPYGDGRSSPRIAAIIADWLGQRKGRASFRKRAPILP
jgi:UDP-N-acetylglucosamine 2-epimerase (non-hydrolysing)